jgi:hypothetical protein
MVVARMPGKNRPCGRLPTALWLKNWRQRPSLREGEKLGRDHHTGIKIKTTALREPFDWTRPRVKS